MNAPSITVACRKCRQVFSPDFKSRKIWRCTHCNSKNPNLRRHYRSMGTLMILGFVFTVLGLIALATRQGFTFRLTILSAHAALLAWAIFAIYRADFPWQSRLAKTLMWSVYIIAFCLNCVLPYLLFGRTGPVFIYLIIFAYLLWLRRATINSELPNPTT